MFALSPLRLDPVAIIGAQIAVIGLGVGDLSSWQLRRIARILRSREGTG